MRASAIARPIPPPVTSATSPSSLDWFAFIVFPAPDLASQRRGVRQILWLVNIAGETGAVDRSHEQS